MVFLVVKGTTYPDEFVVERRLSDVCDPLASQNASFSPNAITPQTDGSPCLIRPHANTADVQQQHCANNSTSTSLDTNPGQTDSADQTSIVPVICHMQNMRHVLRLMLLSARDFAKCVALPNSRQDSKGVMHGHDDNSSCVEVVMNAQCDADENVPASAGVDAERAMESKASVPRPTGAATVQVQSNQDETAAMQRSTSCHDTTVQDTLTRYNALIDVIETHLKDKSIPVSRESWYDEVATQLRELTAALFPDLCCHENGTAEAIDALSGLLDNPDLDEDRRLLVYHCRAILDPQLRARELQAEQTACLWFAGKPMSGTLARYGGRNEKSKIIVKIAPYGGPAPSQEPRMRYEHQRALFHWRAVKREELATLGESELRARVTAQARGRVLLPTKSDKTANVDIHTDRIRPLGGRSENVRL